LVDPSSNLLTKKDRQKRLEPKVILLLNYFVSHANVVVSRQELIAALWPDVVVGDEVVTRAIFSLRNALGDDVKAAKYIETIPKKGYRFLAVASFIEEEKKIPRPVLILFTTIIFIAASLFYVTSDNPPVTKISEILPFTNFKGSEFDPFLNPELQLIAFIHKNGTSNKIMTKNINNGAINTLVDDDRLKRSPKWLDNDTLVYKQCNDNHQACQIMRVYKQESPEVIYKTPKYIFQIEVVEAEQTLIVFSEQKNNESTDLKSLNLVNGKVSSINKRFTSLPKRKYFPIYSSKKNILYLICYIDEKQSIFAFNFSSGELLFSLESFDWITGFAFGLHSDQLLVSAVKGNVQGLWEINTKTAETKLLLRSSGAETIRQAIANTSTNSIYYVTTIVKGDIEQLSFGTNVEELNQLNSAAVEIDATYAKNNQDIYFVSNRTGYDELWFYNAHQRKTKQLTQLKATSMGKAIPSHDEKHVAIVYKRASYHLAIIGIQSGKIINQIKLEEKRFPLAWSLDDQFLYVSEHLKNINLFKYDKQSLTQSLVKPYTGLFAEEIDNGRSLISFDFKENAFIQIHLQAQTTEVITDHVIDSQYLLPGQVKLNEDSIVIAKTQDKQLKTIEYPLLNKHNRNIQVKSKILGDYWVYGISDNAEKLLISTRKKLHGNIINMKLQEK
jgi:DNA-binding winged helix-turn-helix (wHTH) protein